MTLRVRDLSEPNLLPVNSQLLNSVEALEWYMVNVGIQYVGADLLLGHGQLVYFPFFSYGQFAETQWVTELRKRTDAAFSSMLE